MQNAGNWKFPPSHCMQMRGRFRRNILPDLISWTMLFYNLLSSGWFASRGINLLKISGVVLHSSGLLLLNSFSDILGNVYPHIILYDCMVIRRERGRLRDRIWRSLRAISYIFRFWISPWTISPHLSVLIPHTQSVCKKNVPWVVKFCCLSWLSTWISELAWIRESDIRF